MLLEAAQTALEQKDLAAITFVLACCNERRLQEKISLMIASLRNGK
jgi:siroheme synthase (precorrin-2 oxidase/ferrochelatase)